VKTWASFDRHCFAACVATIRELGPEAEDDLLALPASFVYEPEAMAEYNAALEEKLGLRLRQLNAPPPDPRLWIAALRMNAEEGHAVVARGRTIIFDPSDPESDESGLWGQSLPSCFGDRLIDGFELVEV
jgi:hypothetical protein